VEFSAERKEGGGELQNSSESFFIAEAVAEFEPSLNYFVVKKIPEDAEIKIDGLPAAAKALFTGPQGSMGKEWKNMVNQVKAEGGPAVRVHRGARAREIKKNYSHRLVPTRWMHKWKDMGDEYDTPLPPQEILQSAIPEHHGAKSRWIIQGFHDPDITILRRSVPTPETSDVPLCLQMLASIRAKIWVGDVKGAFTQGMRGQRQELGLEPLYALPPPGGIPGESDDIVIEIIAEIYGLITGPPGWRRSLFTTFKNLGFKAHPLAPCVVIMYETLNGKENQFSGLICVETDDLLGGGIGPKYQDAITQLRKEYNFGKWKILQEGPTEYGGRTVWQLPDSDVKISMTRYLKEKAVEIKLARGRGKDPKAKADAGEITQMRGLVGKLNWASREGMPQGAGDASLLASTMPEPTVGDLTEANAAMRRLIQNDVPVWIRSIPLDVLGLVVFEDASLGNTKGGSAQIGHLVCAADKKIHTGAPAKVSVLVYKSHKNPRAAPSTLLNEATGMSEALADSEWVASWIGLCKDLEYDLRKRHLLNREIKIACLSTCHDYSELDLATITDAKSLYDNLMQEQYTGAEKRAALEICVIRDSLETLGGRARWVPHDRNPSDCFTKLHGNVESLLKLMREGSYTLVDEVDEMAQRKLYREQTGKKNPRPNIAVQSQPASYTHFMYTPLFGSALSLSSPPTLPLAPSLVDGTVCAVMPAPTPCLPAKAKKRTYRKFSTTVELYDGAPSSTAAGSAALLSDETPSALGNQREGESGEFHETRANEFLPPVVVENSKGLAFTIVKTGRVSPEKVRFSQSSVAHQFTDGKSYNALFRGIAENTLNITDVPPIRVVERSDGLYFSHDNRRLMVFKWLFQTNHLTLIPVVVVSDPIPESQLTTRCDGRDVHIRDPEPHVKELMETSKDASRVSQDKRCARKWAKADKWLDQWKELDALHYPTLPVGASYPALPARAPVPTAQAPSASDLSSERDPVPSQEQPEPVEESSEDSSESESQSEPEPTSDFDDGLLSQFEFDEKLQEHKLFPTVFQEPLPKDPTAQLGQTLVATKEDHDSLQDGMNCQADDLATLVQALNAYAKDQRNYKIFSGLPTSSHQPHEIAKLNKITRHVEQIQVGMTITTKLLNQLRAHAVLAQEAVERSKKATLQDLEELTVPPQVYNYLYYLEARSIQRKRAAQMARGEPTTSTHRQWKRVLHSNLRARMFNFTRDFAHRVGQQRSAAEVDDVNCGQMTVKAEKNIRFETAAALELRLDQRFSKENRQLQDLVHVHSFEHAPVEPTREKGRHKRRSAGYKTAKNQRKKANKKAKLLGSMKDEASPDEADLFGDDDPQAPSALVESSVRAPVVLVARQDLSPFHTKVKDLVIQCNILITKCREVYHFDPQEETFIEELSIICLHCGSENSPMSLICLTCRKMFPVEQLDLHKLRLDTGFEDPPTTQAEADLPVPGETGRDYQPAAPIVEYKTTAPHSTLNLIGLDHWSRGFLNSRTNKHFFEEACQGISEDNWKLLNKVTPCANDVVKAWREHGIEYKKGQICHEVDDFIPTQGRWYFSDLMLPHPTANPHSWKKFANPQVAYHGCSIKAAALIVRHGIKNGVYTTDGKIGVYCEQRKRINSTPQYATHTMTPSHPGLLTACIFEFMVDRDQGATINNQWVQPEQSIMITGVYTHLLPVNLLYKKGFLGWWRVHSSAFTRMKGIQDLLEDL